MPTEYQTKVPAMSLEAFQEWFHNDAGMCGCGHGKDALVRLRDLLSAHEQSKTKLEKLDALIPDRGLQTLILWHLDSLGLTEHGGSVYGAWLTDQGAAVLGFLREKSDTELDGVV